ncbi:MAG: four helix bundle protein [Fusobacteriaceae bacterium]|nr:four helix bundle protein [Fusobacteriaceae bacterium]MBN2838857.1 four helix bundle protein [Fusobacteriaceae bacterium]
MRKESIVYEKAFNFAVRIVKMYKYLCGGKKEYILSKQLVRSGTSIGANIAEGLEGQSKKDFIAKLSIAFKEAVESKYWIDLFRETEYLNEDEYNSIYQDVMELIKMLTRIIKTTKENNFEI